MLEVLIVVAGLIALAYGLLRFKVHSVRARHRRRIADAEPEHSSGAHLVGIASEGRLQIRGLGTLVLGRTQLVFVQLVPERDIIVPRVAITSARSTRHFLGKTTESDLLVVTWDVDGTADAMALAVADLDDWRERLT